MNVYVARQPIFDRHKNVFGYELLYRSGSDNYFPEVDATRATAEVIVNSFVTMDLYSITRGKKAFVKFTGRLLQEETAFLFSPASLVVQLLEMPLSKSVLDLCARLKQNGYLIALDDIKPQSSSEPLLQMADIIKIDYQEMKAEEREALVKRLKKYRAKLLAEKVETMEEYTDALERGYSFFQGYFFCEPVVVEGKELSGSKLHNLQLIQEIYRPEIDIDRLETLIKQDLTLSYQLLRFINSAAFQICLPVRSIRQAIVLLGRKELSKWVSLMTLRSMGYDKPDELIVTALCRGRFCESLAALTGLKARATDLFLTGLFSLLDAFLGQPMEAIMEELPLDHEIKATLLGRESLFKDIFDLVVHYEKRNWQEASSIAAKLRISQEKLFSCYLNSVEQSEIVLVE